MDRRKVPWWVKIPLIGELFWNPYWILEFGVVYPWFSDYRRARNQADSFIKELKKGGAVFHCWKCAFWILCFRIVLAPITLPAALLSRWVWRASYTGRIRWLFRDYYKWKMIREKTRLDRKIAPLMDWAFPLR